MELAYLGLFQKIFNWVLSHIFDPVFKWLSSLLSTVLSWVFNNILANILFPVLQDVLNYAIALLKTLFCGIFYRLFAGILKLIDYMAEAFDIFIGIQDVSLVQTIDHGETTETVTIIGSLAEVLLQQPVINQVFWALTLGGLGIAMILTTYATAKSAFDLDFENKRPVSKVLSSMMRAFIQFFTVPFLVYFMLRLAVFILQSVSAVMGGGTDTTLGRIIFVIASLNAAKSTSGVKNYKDLKEPLDLFDDRVRFCFYSKTPEKVQPNLKAMDYTNVDQVTQYFELANFDYLIGIIAAVFLFVIMAICLIVFVQRIFDIVLLYIVSPYFVSTIPLDDGERFGRWRELFIGKCFSGFGSAIGMRLYLMICPLVMTGSLRFGGGSSPEMDYLMKLFFLIGGAWAVFKSGPMITQLISVQAGQTESTTQAAAAGAIYKNTVTRTQRMISAHRQKKQNQNQNQNQMQAQIEMGQQAYRGLNTRITISGLEAKGKWSLMISMNEARQKQNREFGSAIANQNRAAVQEKRQGLKGAGGLFRSHLASNQAARNAAARNKTGMNPANLPNSANSASSAIQSGRFRSDMVRKTEQTVKKEIITKQVVIRESRIVTVRDGGGRTPMYRSHSVQPYSRMKPGTGGK